MSLAKQVCYGEDKVRIYEACVLSTLLYASEPWTTNTGQERKLNIFHLHKILNIKWQDRVSNYRILEMAGLTSITTILSRRRMKWLGYVYRMDNTCIPKKCLFGELSSGKRSQVRPKLHYKGVCKDTMRHLQIHPKSWERMASDQSAWKTAVRTGATLQEEMLRVEWEEKQDQRKQRVRETTALSNFDTLTCRYSSRPCRSNSVRISHERSCSKKKLTSSKLL